MFCIPNSTALTHKFSGYSGRSQHALGKVTVKRDGSVGLLQTRYLIFVHLTWAYDHMDIPHPSEGLRSFTLTSLRMNSLWLSPVHKWKKWKLRKVLSFSKVTQLVGKWTPGLQQVLCLHRSCIFCRPAPSPAVPPAFGGAVDFWGIQMSHWANSSLKKGKKEKGYLFTLSDMCVGWGNTFKW